MSKKNHPKPWKPHKMVLVSLGHGVRCEVDANLVNILKFLNYNGIETRHSCEGRKRSRGYISMFGTPKALGLAHYLIDNGSKVDVIIERCVHPTGYENLVIRWPKKNQKQFENLVRKYFR